MENEISTPEIKSGHENQKRTFRIVSCAANGSYVIRDFDGPEEIANRYAQIGVDDCSLDLDIRGLPIFQGLVGPIPEQDKEGKIARYETPEVFEALSRQYYEEVPKSRRSSRTQNDK